MRKPVFPLRVLFVLSMILAVVGPLGGEVSAACETVTTPDGGTSTQCSSSTSTSTSTSTSSSSSTSIVNGEVVENTSTCTKTRTTTVNGVTTTENLPC